MSIVLPEIVSIGIYNSAIAVKNRAVTKNRNTTMFEIELPIGEGGISYIGNDSTKITEDILICSKPGQIRHTRLPFKCYYIHFLLNEGCIYDMLCAMPDFISIGDRQKYEDIFKKLCKYYESGRENDKLMLQSLILELIYNMERISKKALAIGKSGNNQQAIESTIKYIKDNLTADLSLDVLAERVSFSPIHFHNSFKAATGKTLHDYVEEQRIKKSINLLITGDKTLTEIAYECGFSSQAYFSFVFKRRTKTTPREYARIIIAQYDAGK